MGVRLVFRSNDVVSPSHRAEVLERTAGDRGATGGGAPRSDVRSLFDSLASSWSGKYADGRLAPRVVSFTAALREVVAPPSRILDFGCGTGEIARSLAGDGFHLTACDLSPAMLARARDGDETVVWVLREQPDEPLPFPDASFDAIVASSVLEYVTDLDLGLAELGRVLKPGGLLVATVPNAEHPIRYLEGLMEHVIRLVPSLGRAAEVMPRTRSYATYLRVSVNRSSRSTWSRLAEAHGFQMKPLRARSPTRTLDLLCFQRVVA